jgi:hypothetical protein
MRVVIKTILPFFMFLLFFSACSDKKQREDPQVAVLLMNSTHSPLRVTFEKRLQNGKLIKPIYLEVTIEGGTKVEKIIDPAIYKVKVWGINNELSGQIKDFIFELHTDSTLEHPYYLDVALNKKYAITDLDFIFRDTSSIDFSNFEVFKIYDGDEPFEIAEVVRYHDIIFLEDKIPHQMNEHKKLYCAYPVPSALNEKEIHLYLEEQIRVHYLD